MMGTELMAVLLAVLAGVGIAVQSTLNNLLTKTVGIWTTNVIVHGTGFLLAMGITLWLGKSQFNGVMYAPWYSLLGGFFGVFAIATVVFAISKLGVGFSVTVMVVAQVMAATMIDHYGLLGAPTVLLTWKRIAGIGLLIIGAILIKK